MIVLCSVNDRKSWRGEVWSTCVQAVVDKEVCGNIEFLAPTPALVFGHKAGKGDKRFSRYAKVSDEQYINGYRRLLASRWSQVKAWLDSLDANSDMTLLCYCHIGKFCHRQLLARMIQKWRPDITVVLR